MLKFKKQKFNYMYERETHNEFSSIKSSSEIRPRNEAKNIWLFLLPVSKLFNEYSYNVLLEKY
jgi:hypothetical protein